MLDEDAVTDAARRLLAAERSREPIRQLPVPVNGPRRRNGVNHPKTYAVV